MQKLYFPEHSVQGASHLLHYAPTFVDPDGQTDTHASLKNNPVEHTHTPFTGLLPDGHDLEH